MKGQIPPTEVCILESEEDQWMMLSRGLINELSTSVLVYQASGQQVRIDLVINKILTPEQSHFNYNYQTQTNLGKKAALGISRTREFLSNYLDKHIWIMLGYIVGEEKKPIFIIHCTLLNLSIYTQKLKDEEIKGFFPLPAPGQN